MHVQSAHAEVYYVIYARVEWDDRAVLPEFQGGVYLATELHELCQGAARGEALVGAWRRNWKDVGSKCTSFVEVLHVEPFQHEFFDSSRGVCVHSLDVLLGYLQQRFSLRAAL